MSEWQDLVIRFADQGMSQAAACANAEAWVWEHHPDVERGSQEFYRLVYSRAVHLWETQ